MRTKTPEVDMVAGLCSEIAPLLHGYPPEVQGAVLCSLLGTWLAGHHASDERQTQAMRHALLAMHVQAVMQFVAAEEGN